MIFTHFGISGPIIMHMSAIIYEALESTKRVFLSIDFKPEMSVGALEEAFQKEFKDSPARKISNVLKEFVPARRILESHAF
jgi:predicted flavoprotein YhiN